MIERVRTRVAQGPERWALLLVPTAAWLVHLVFSASAVEWTCSHPEWRWTLYAITAITAAPTAACAALGWLLTRSDPDGSVNGQARFLGFVALATGLFNLVLILAEGLMVPFLSSCG